MIWLIGSGPMGIEYSDVLEAQECNYLVIGRGSASAHTFTTQTGKDVILSGLDSFLDTSPEIPKSAIVSVGVAQLYDTTLRLIEYGVLQILVEKPAGISQQEIDFLCEKSAAKGCSISVAYNRRFFASVLAAKERISQEGGVTSFNFELTEWSHVIETLEKAEAVLSKWFLANSTHVADLAFYLGGKPKELASFVQGRLDWHPAASVFSGAGVSDTGALFNYTANWETAGRWSVEVLTKESRYILRPMEKLQMQKRGEISVSDVEIDDELDQKYKPGLYRQVEAFLRQDDETLCSLSEQRGQFKFFERMAGYVKY